MKLANKSLGEKNEVIFISELGLRLFVDDIGVDDGNIENPEEDCPPPFGLLVVEEVVLCELVGQIDSLHIFDVLEEQMGLGMLDVGVEMFEPTARWTELCAFQVGEQSQVPFVLMQNAQHGLAFESEELGLALFELVLQSLDLDRQAPASAIDHSYKVHFVLAQVLHRLQVGVEVVGDQ